MANKIYRLLGPDGKTYESSTPGTLGGNRNAMIYGRLDCSAAIAALPRGYARHRVFFADEAAAIAAGYRPCGRCMRARYLEWRAGGEPGTSAYPWHRGPDKA
ncbi:MAG: hypothetical protein RLZZ387_3332 [Chloroflexota bacterium]